jgi:hypothetical protein
MNGKIKMYLGLAMVLVVSAMATVGLFAFSAAPTAEAKITNGLTGVADGVGPRGAGEGFSPLVATTDVTGSITSVTVVQSPTDPGAAASYTVKFTTDHTLQNGSDTVVVTFDNEVGIPTILDRNNISISADTVSGGTNPAAGEAIAPLDVTVRLVDEANDKTEVTLTVPDMDSSDNTGGNSIAAGAKVTIIFRQAAGLTNATEGGGDPISVRTSQSTTDVTITVTTPRLIEISDDDGARGSTITVIGKGFKNSTTTTFWRDADGDGLRDSGELDLCSAVAGSDDVATCTLTITNPPFEPGTFASGGSCTLGALSGCNYINAIDGRSFTSTQATATDISRQRYKLEGSVTVSPAEGDPGDTVTIQLKDFPGGALAAGCCDLAGVAITTDDKGTVLTTLVVPASGELNFGINIPDGVPEGKQALRIKEPVSGSSRRKTITVGGATIIPTPEDVVANQRLTIIGTGYTEGGATTINLLNDGSSITIGGETIPRTRINDGNTITIDNGGNWSASLDLPVSNATTTEGSHELKVTDSNGRQGTSSLTFFDRIMTVSPSEGRVGTNTTVAGSGFPGKNDDGSSINVTVTYDAGGGGTTTTTATPDASGNWSVTLRVPTGASIPSTNTVKAEFTDDNSLKVITTLIHEVPRATITLDPISGPPGTTVTLTAEGFKRFSPVETAKVSTTDVTPAPKPSTDDNGSMTFDFIIPGLDIGTQTVEVKVSGTTASAGITVTDSGVPTGSATPVVDAVEPIGDALVRVFSFNNATKTWTFYDPRPDFADANTIDELVGGAVYWINVTEAQTSILLNNTPRSLTCSGDDCWNLLVW